VLAGIGIGFAETAETTVVARGLPDHLRSNGFGVLGLTQALGDLGSTVVAGVLWSLVSPTVAFCYLTAWMLASLLASGLLRPAIAGQRATLTATRPTLIGGRGRGELRPRCRNYPRARRAQSG